MAWFKKEKTPKLPTGDRRFTIPEGLWVKCDNCKEIIYKKEVAPGGRMPGHGWSPSTWPSAMHTRASWAVKSPGLRNCTGWVATTGREQLPASRTAAST